MRRAYKVIHISDPHFHRLPTRAAEWMSKRGIGALNLMLRRAHQHPLARARKMVEAIRSQPWDHLVITGDLTQLALDAEFALAREILEPLLEGGAERVTVVPGNHDRYVDDPRARAAFRRYFGDFSGEGEISTKQLTERWWLAGWDSTRATRAFDASGRVRPETLAATERWLAGLPAGARVAIANHYPVLSPPDYPSPHLHDLDNREEVLQWLLAHPIELYLHGHVHRNWVMTLEEGMRPLTVVNSASTTRLPRPGDPSALHRIELTEAGAEVFPLHLD
ncbi:MAG: metallophosphoesterase family protein [bacterium]